MIETCLRSATAVAMVDGTKLQEIGEEEFYDFLQHNPERLLQIIRQMRTRIRENTEKYQDTCCTQLIRKQRRMAKQKVPIWISSCRKSAVRQKKEDRLFWFVLFFL